MERSPKAILESIDTSRPGITYEGPKARRDSSELLSAAGAYLRPHGTVLDLGCGPRDQAVPIHYLGHNYVGIDIANSAADILADAHAIPFKSMTFDCVLSYATLEHLHNPFLAITEVERVLKPGGVFVGTVSQGEPFHASFSHHTAWGPPIVSRFNLFIRFFGPFLSLRNDTASFGGDFPLMLHTAMFRIPPQSKRMGDRIYALILPPFFFVTNAMQRPMMRDA